MEKTKSYKSVAQQRKVKLRLIIAVLGILALFAVAWIKGISSEKAAKLIASHQVAQATVLSLQHNQIKAAKTDEQDYKNIYSLQYQFTANGNTYEKTLLLSSFDYESFQGIEQIEVWYDPSNPQHNSTEKELKKKAKTSSFTLRLVSAAIFVFPAMLFLFKFIAFFYVREPKGALPIGFYTDTSWLDIEDYCLTEIENDTLRVAKFDKKKVSKVQSLYQSGTAFSEIVAAVKADETLVPLNKVSLLESKHYKDQISIEWQDNDEEHDIRVQFLSVAAKEHALARISALIPGSLVHQVVARGPVQSASASFVGVILGAAVIATAMLYEFSGKNLDVVLFAFGGLIIYFALPSMIARLLDPTVITSWSDGSAK
ncbi:DUF3592 domain-containing protein [Rheinheimera baltica]|uniref:DUF3592 domain-containing protein n=1 Tax=Rheinheimera baltica TaxID=67576 RepID=A0ABT9I2Q6_9GAMM|nr:DUF3592 domain-containing protein [Rheinheimera baltica]MDP5137660.1 DUF3592 domain-containing protein [Rheinheimera baltica]MDP5143826.1 DUF3592 domain-containing protein [Rheinheimera baltica]